MTDTPCASKRPRSYRRKLALTVATMFIGMIAAVILLQNLTLNQILDKRFDSIATGNGPTLQDQSSSEDNGSLQEQSIECEGEHCEDATLETLDASPQDVTGTALTMRDSIVTATWHASTVIFVSTALASVFIVWMLAGRMSRQLDSISTQASQLDPSDLSTRITTDYADQEVGVLALTLNTMLARIERFSDVQRDFVRNASHELATPVTTIGTSLESLMHQHRFTSDVEPVIQRAIEANRASASLISNLLELSRIQANAQTDLGLVDISQLTQDCFLQYGDTIRSKHIEVIIEYGPTAIANTNKQYARIVLDNLVRNAIIHNIEHGSISVRTKLKRGTAPKPALVLSIENTTVSQGQNIDALDLMQPFHRGNATRLAGNPGHGLGLPIARAAAEACGAALDVTFPADGDFLATLTFPSPQPAGSTAPAGETVFDTIRNGQRSHLQRSKEPR